MAAKYVYNSPYAFQENKLGLGRELEGLELMPHDWLMNYLTVKAAQWRSNVSPSQRTFKDAVNNRASASVRGEINNMNINVANININADKAKDIINISNSVGTISKETVNTVKEVTRDAADGLETSGDALIIAAPATGPAAPVVAGAGEVLSTTVTVTNIGLDLLEGNLESAGERAAIEIVTGGVSTLAKKAPGVDGSTSRLVDSHIATYEEVVVPAVQEEMDAQNDL